MNTKTILFAALFAAMILPAGMQSVYAVSEPEGAHGPPAEPSGTPTVPDEPYDGTYVPTHPQVEVIPDGSSLPADAIPDRTNAPEVPVDQTDPGA